MPSHSPAVLPLVLFALTYLALALGRLPWLALDRTGCAILGASAFLLTGTVTLDEVKSALDIPTLSVLFGMMLLSAQYRYSGLYAAIAQQLAHLDRPRLLLLGTIAVAAALSAVLTNDVVCFALAPLLGAVLLRTGRNPLPFLIGLACASNLGGALTPIGNPQNILIAQRLRLQFLPFVLVCAAPVVLSLAFLYWLLARRIARSGGPRRAAAGAAAPAERRGADREPLLTVVNRREAAKAVLLTAAAVALFLSPVPAALTALGVGAAVLVSPRFATRRALAEVDWDLLALFVSLFILQRGISLSGWTDAARNALLAGGLDLSRTVVLVPVAAVLSNLVSNVPAVMLLLPFVDPGPAAGHALALATTFAGNAFLMGSIANLIVAAQAERLGIRLGFVDHLRIGLPLTLVSLTLAAAELALLASH
jgi:Na+/H+ antiporter NhaD/arsenite permease-like protein